MAIFCEMVACRDICCERPATAAALQPAQRCWRLQAAANTNNHIFICCLLQDIAPENRSPALRAAIAAASGPATSFDPSLSASASTESDAGVASAGRGAASSDGAAAAAAGEGSGRAGPTVADRLAEKYAQDQRAAKEVRQLMMKEQLFAVVDLRYQFDSAMPA